MQNEAEHLPCLKCGEEEGVKHDDFCPICWTEGLSVAPALKLACGHIVHEHCIKKQLNERWGDKPRIQFGFLACPACRQDVFHPGLEVEFIKPIMQLKERVEAMAAEQMAIEYPMMDKEEQEKADAAGHRAYAEGHLSFELCHKCQLPYFAGRVDCAAGLDEAGPEAMAVAQDAVCASCRGLSGLGKPCEKHGKEALVWKCRYGCHLATYECFNYLHVCNPCHNNDILCKMMDFNVRVEAGHPRRGGVPGDERVYSNKKDIWEYDQCPGPESCPLGCAHPPTGIEYCFGCSLCKDELSTLQKTLAPLRPLFLKLAATLVAGHTDDFDEDNNNEFEARFRHVVWLAGQKAVEQSEMSKRESIHTMQYFLLCAQLPLDKYEVKIKGSVDALRKRLRPKELASVVAQWRAEPVVYAEIEKTSCLTVSVTRSLKDPTRPTVNLAVRYRQQDGAALPQGTLSGACTVKEVVEHLAANTTEGIKCDANGITLLHNGEALKPEDKLLPLFTKPTLQLGTKVAGGFFSECVIA